MLTHLDIDFDKYIALPIIIMYDSAASRKIQADCICKCCSTVCMKTGLLQLYTNIKIQTVHIYMQGLKPQFTIPKEPIRYFSCQ